LSLKTTSPVSDVPGVGGIGVCYVEHFFANVCVLRNQRASSWKS
jgi:hypothetical protein